jgi:tetratricopeptide (TPR) repeat protein
MKHIRTLLLCFFLLFVSWTLPVCAQSKNPQKPELIRDTDVAEGKDASETPTIKEQNPALAKQNITIGNFYFKQKNYAAAIERYLEATEYQSNSIPAFEALARAYEKNGDITKAIDTYKSYIDKNPGSPGAFDFRIRLENLEKKSK